MSFVRFLCLGLLLGATPGLVPVSAASELKTETDARGAFSLSFPSDWSSTASTHGALSEVALFASAPLDISIVAASRPLTPQELALEPSALLDELVLLTVDNQGALGNQVIDAGRVDPFVPDWPAFSVVATDSEQRKMITCWRFVVEERLFTLTTMTDNSQASPELGATVREVIESFRVLERP